MLCLLLPTLQLTRVAFLFKFFRGGGIERVVITLANRLAEREDIQMSIMYMDLGPSVGAFSKNVRLLQIDKNFSMSQREFKKYGFDMVILHNYYNADMYDLARMLRVFNISCGFVYHTAFSALLDFGHEHAVMMRKGFQAATAVVTISRYDREMWKRFGVKRTIYIQNPLTYSEQMMLASQNQNEIAPQERNLILSVGRLDRRVKRQHLAIEAFRHFDQKLPGYKLAIIGNQEDKEYLKQLQDLVKYYQLDEKVEFIPHTNEPEQYYKRAKVLFATSAYEGHMMAIAEAKQFGVLVAMLDLPYIEIGRKGVLKVDNDDTKVLGERVAEVVQDNALLLKYISEGLESLDEFTDEVVLTKWLKFFKMLETRKIQGFKRDTPLDEQEVERIMQLTNAQELLDLVNLK